MKDELFLTIGKIFLNAVTFGLLYLMLRTVRHMRIKRQRNKVLTMLEHKLVTQLDHDHDGDIDLDDLIGKETSHEQSGTNTTTKASDKGTSE